MIDFLKNRRETIFFVASLVLFAIVLLVTFRAIRGLTEEISGAVDLQSLRASSEPVNFNLEKFESLGFSIIE